MVSGVGRSVRKDWIDKINLNEVARKNSMLSSDANGSGKKKYDHGEKRNGRAETTIPHQPIGHQLVLGGGRWGVGGFGIVWEENKPNNANDKWQSGPVLVLSGFDRILR